MLLISGVQNPAFSNSHLREMTEIFVSKSAEVHMTLFSFEGSVLIGNTVERMSIGTNSRLSSPWSGERRDALLAFACNTRRHRSRWFRLLL